MRDYEKPTMKQEGDREVYEHPAYGLVGMSIVTGGGGHLFASDINHNQRVRIQIKRARHERDLSTDWYHGKGRRLIEIELSHAQFSEFITSSNRGEGVPCTITEIAGDMVPAIEPVENKKEMLKREVHAAAHKRMAAARKDVRKLGELIESGKLSKTALRDLHKSLDGIIGGLPNHIEFIVDMGQEAMEHLVTHAKIEIEATVAAQVRKLGLEAAHKAGIIGPDYQLPAA
jgi:hypothetical protein